MSKPLHFILVWVLTLIFNAVYALQNFTVDDTDVRIHYTGQWNTKSLPGNYDYGGSHQWSSDPTATATFTFTGVEVYYMSALFSASVTSQIALDGGPEHFVNLTSPGGGATDEVVWSDVVWSAAQLEDTQHTVAVSAVQTNGGRSGYVIVDAFIYTVTTSSVSGGPSLSDKIALGVGLGLGVPALVVAICLMVLYGLELVLTLLSLLTFRNARKQDRAK